MKRNWDLIRELLLEIEAMEPGHLASLHCTDGCSLEEADYHLHLLEQAGLVECKEQHQWNGESGRVASSLTLQGHDLLDSIRDQDTWNAKKTMLLQRLGAISYESLRKVF
ncbi:DUF2513 domain-containing protein [Pseudomonas sp. JS3066]|jgi:hypothetical protein|uniref:DUF2513 domain-containing protein n=1 Tax=unclassified Pseudomonas TaxID=196821 RepID=UPI0013C4DBE5|nr:MULTISPECIES: DUF2513 domain-containing protein [unclassified Pseudomonas]WVK95790.1 DUF2513 domain-containing protein [Pseudomonas sp. JS3066]